MPEDKDLLNGDHSFKMWFSIMWKNFFIQIFLLALFAIGLVLFFFNDQEKGTEFYIALLIPTAAAIITAFKGFIQFWNDLKNGRSR